MSPSPSGQPDQQPDHSPATQDPAHSPTQERAEGYGTSDAAVTNPLRRSDLVSYGFRGFMERLVIGRGTIGRICATVGVFVLLIAAVAFAYVWLVGLDADGEFYNPAMTLMVVGAQAAQGFFPREAERHPYVGYTITSALQTAALAYIIFVLATEPLNGESLFFLLAYAFLCMVGEVTRFSIDTRIRRTHMMQAETGADDIERRRALHMDR